MFVDKAFELLKEMERNPERILSFDENALRQIFDEMQNLMEQNQRDAQSQSLQNSEINTEALDMYHSIQFRHAALEKNKQCVLAYIYNRLLQIQDIRWAHGSVIPGDIRLNLTEQEAQFFNNYNKVLANYMRSIGENTGLDLTLDFEPPKSLMITVKVAQEYGELETPAGDIIVLKKDSIHYLPKAQCESLIRQGILEPIS